MSWLNIASRLPYTEAEGPGRRAALWVQGCDKRCHGCCNPGYLRIEQRELVQADEVISWLEAAHRDHDLEGITFLGGEPMLQAKGLALVAEGARRLDLSVMVFSGYTVEELEALRLPGSDALLSATDVLVDGPYESALPERHRRWSGSTNQRFHYLTNRYDVSIEGRDDTVERTVEWRIRADGTVFMNGWPERIRLR
ncbi:4Fe-4S single cluster domain-containing protein [Paraburkholderia sp. RL17-347-BIC-D]|uniref:4Fe-4S single cluster domain-containing protein n=1 Tax=Paraburkholderia sp. RL17-347-BIC-D TaxID=3031632 RepID=UPI0038BA5B4C